VSAFLFKTEPSEYGWADLVRDRRTTWSGISNATALIHLRKVRSGDTVLLYHTASEKSVVGAARAASDPYPDPALGDPKRVVVDLVPVRAFARPVTLAEIKADPLLRGMDLVRITRLSVMPVSEPQLARLASLGGSAGDAARAGRR
jgi:predicted RNA-binding protein with PUA-like domain